MFRRSPKLEDLDKKLVFSLRRARLPGLRQLKLLPALLTPAERWIVRIALASLLLGLVILSTPRIAPHIVAVPKSGGTYTEGLVGSPRLINPILAATDVDLDLTRLLYSGLLRYNGKGELEGDLAERWEVGFQGLTFTFTLRDNLRFHDGQPLTSQDVKFTLEAIKNPAWRSPFWSSLQDVEVETPDQKTIKVSFKILSPSALHLFTVGILPKHLWGEVDPTLADRAVWNLKPIGNGPFKFKRLSKSERGGLSSYTLSRYNEYHHDAPYLAEVAIRFFTDFESALTALREHRIEGVSFVPLRLRNRVPAKDFDLYKISIPQFTGIFFQDRKNEFLRDRLVRRALTYAAPRNELNAMLPEVETYSTPFLKGELGYARTLPAQNFDLEKAKIFLETAGWEKEEKDNRLSWVKNGKKLALTLTTLDEPTLIAVAEIVKRGWDNLGVAVKLEVVPRINFERELLRPRAYEALLFSELGGADPDPYSFWHSSQIDDPGVNLSSIKNRAMDTAIEKGRSTVDQNRRSLAYIEFQEQFLHEAPAIILYSSPYLYVTSGKIRGVTIERIAYPADRFYGIERWYRRFRPGWK